MTPPPLGAGLSVVGAGMVGRGAVAAAAILDSAVALAAVRRRAWGVALPSPSPRFLGGGSSHWGGAAAVASTAMAATTANPGEETEDWGACQGGGAERVGNWVDPALRGRSWG